MNRCGDTLYCERLSSVFERLQVKYGAVAGLNKKTTRLTCGTTSSVCFRYPETLFMLKPETRGNTARVQIGIWDLHYS